MQQGLVLRQALPLPEVKLTNASPEASDLGFPINLATALALSGARPLIVTAAQAAAWVAEAQLERAEVLWVPTLDLGSVYMRHDGVGPDLNNGTNLPPFAPFTPRVPIRQYMNYFYTGAGFVLAVATTEAIFQPLVARQVLTARRWNVQSAKNDALLATAEAYFSVHQYRGTYAGAVDAVARGRKLVGRITDLSQDLVPRVEINRAMRLLADLEQQAALARQRWRVASANLTQVLRLSPSVVVLPAEPDHLQITLIDPSRSLDQLLPIALKHRPELASQRALIAAAEQRIRREKSRPFLPIVLLTGWQSPGEMTEFGIFGTGPGSNLNNWSFRTDVSVQLVWQFENLGLGNLARIKDQRAQESRAIVRLYAIQDRVAAEVTEAQATLQSAAARVVEAERALRNAIINFDRNYEGLRHTKRFSNFLYLVIRPQEADIALEHLMVSYRQYFGSVADYNRAQFELFHALGYPAEEIANLHPPGNVVAVRGRRPFGLPPVPEGPPPATR